MADKKADNVSLIATANFSSAKNEGSVKKGQAFETTPERATYLVDERKVARAADAK